MIDPELGIKELKNCVLIVTDPTKFNELGEERFIKKYKELHPTHYVTGVKVV